jgi:hypothetical protein
MKRYSLLGENQHGVKITLKTVFSKFKLFIDVINFINYFFKIQTFMSN